MCTTVHHLVIDQNYSDKIRSHLPQHHSTMSFLASSLSNFYVSIILQCPSCLKLTVYDQWTY